MIRMFSALVSKLLGALIANENQGASKAWLAVKTVCRHPVRTVGAFLFAPVLIAIIAYRSDHGLARRVIAAAGLAIGFWLAWFAGTGIGVLSGAVLLRMGVGAFYGAAFWLGAMMSLTLTLLFQVIVLQATCSLFLKLSSREVVEHLSTLVDGIGEKAMKDEVTETA